LILDSFLLSITAVPGPRSQQVDVTSAFLYADLKELIYMNLSKGRREKGTTAQLSKYIYSLEQSSRMWYEQLMLHFVSYRFVTSNFDLGILIHKTEAFFIAINVVNITRYRSGGLKMKNVKYTLKSEIEAKDFVNCQ
jgi:hypothetical protein